MKYFVDRLGYVLSLPYFSTSSLFTGPVAVSALLKPPPGGLSALIPSPARLHQASARMFVPMDPIGCVSAAARVTLGLGFFGRSQCTRWLSATNDEVALGGPLGYSVPVRQS